MGLALVHFQKYWLFSSHFLLCFQDTIYAVTGAIFYIAAGGCQLDATTNDAGKGLGSMCIITGAVFIVDSAFALISLQKDL